MLVLRKDCLFFTICTPFIILHTIIMDTNRSNLMKNDKKKFEDILGKISQMYLFLDSLRNPEVLSL